MKRGEGTKRLNISIPSWLYDRIAERRAAGDTFNLSRLCSKALEDYLVGRVTTQQSPSMPERVERIEKWIKGVQCVFGDFS
jgi:hypothetical protein